MYLVPNVVISKKFRVPEFIKYTGSWPFWYGYNKIRQLSLRKLDMDFFYSSVLIYMHRENKYIIYF
jgi:hypothetical protein